MTPTTVSVVIPTYQRAATLVRCLDALAGQDLDPDAYEVVVVDDGGHDETHSVVDAAARTASVSLTYLVQQHRGPSAARNLGVDHAGGDVVVFIGDDIIPTAGFLACHLGAHRHAPEPGLAVLGQTAWAPWLRVGLLMEFLEQNGEQFAFSKIENPHDVPVRFFYTSNVSLKRSFLTGGPRFDVDLFPWEDVDLAQRLQPLGLRILYEPGALAFHDHPTDLAAFLRRMRQSGVAARILDTKRGIDSRLASTEQMLSENRRNHRLRTVLHPLARLLGWRRVAFAYYEHRGLEEFCRGYRQ